MKMSRMFMVGLTVLATWAVASCSDPAAPIDGLVERIGAADGASASAAAVGHHVVGSGHLQSAAGQREFTFHAVEGPQGDVSGSYKIVLPNGLFFETDVTCMAVEGDTGWVAGTIRATNAGVVIVGSHSMFYAIDDGEGDGAQDIVSIAAFNMPAGTDLEFCEERPLILAPLSVTDGNVQVR